MLLALANPLQADNSCLLCNTQNSKEAKKSSAVSPCEDLYSAACLDGQGNSKYQGKYKALTDDLGGNIKEAKEKAAKKAGHDSTSETILKAIEAEGIQIKPEMRAQVAKSMMGGPEMMYLPNMNSKDYYVKPVECTKAVIEVTSKPYYNVTDPAELERIIAAANELKNKYEVDISKLHARDISTFMAAEYGAKCGSLQFSLTSAAAMQAKREENEELIKACQNAEQVKRKAIDLYRLEGTDKYQAQAEAFVREHKLPELKFQQVAVPPPAGAPVKSAEEQKLEALRSKVYTASNSALMVCASLSSFTDGAARNAAIKAQQSITKSRATIEHLIDSTYTDSRKVKAETLFRGAKKDIQDVIAQVVKDPQKKAEILDGYDNLGLYWMEKPKADQYKKDITGLEVLDEEKFELMDQRLMVFSDPSLSYFGQPNAFYMPQMSFGKMKSEEKVTMMPAFLREIDNNPAQFLAVAAHEAGHKIGPMVSKMNGYDLSPEYSSLLACYSDRDSIKMSQAQKDETISDYFSSEVLARQVAKLPADEREEKLLASMGAFCTFSDATPHAVNCKGVHPDPILRVGGIYGANPSIRKVLGCKEDSGRYKSCGLEKSIMDIPESKAAKPASNATQESNSQRGVK